MLQERRLTATQHDFRPLANEWAPRQNRRTLDSYELALMRA
jgi:hypothetical protein